MNPLYTHLPIFSRISIATGHAGFACGDFTKWAVAFLIQCTVLYGTLTQVVYADGGRMGNYPGSYRVDSSPLNVRPGKADAAFGRANVCQTNDFPGVFERTDKPKGYTGTSGWLSRIYRRTKGVDYVSTCFRQNGFPGYGYQAKAPVEGGKHISDRRTTLIINRQIFKRVWHMLNQKLQAS